MRCTVFDTSSTTAVASCPVEDKQALRRSVRAPHHTIGELDCNFVRGDKSAKVAERALALNWHVVAEESRVNRFGPRLWEGT